MRLLLVVPLLAAACAPEPAPLIAPAPVAPPATTSTLVAIAPSATATAASDDGPRVALPFAMRWTYDLPSVGGRPWTKQHLVVEESGAATWQAATGGGDGEIDEALSPRAPDRGPPPVRCQAQLDPRLHRAIVEAARRAMTAGCTMKAPRLVDTAQTTLAVTWEGQIRACNVQRAGGGYAAFEQVREEAVAAICKR